LAGLRADVFGRAKKGRRAIAGLTNSGRPVSVFEEGKMDRNIHLIYSPEAAFRLGYDQGDRRRQKEQPGATGAPLDRPLSDISGFEEEWERGYRAGLHGEPAPTTFT